MRITKQLVRLGSLLLIVSLLNSCVYRAVFPLPKSPPPSFKGRVVRLYQPEKPLNMLYMDDLSFQNEQLSGTLFQTEGNQNFTARIPDQITIYLRSGVVFPDSLPTSFTLPMSQVERMEVYDVDLGKTIFVNALTFVGISAAAFLVFCLIVLLTKESCPFIYVFNGKEYEFTGEIYSGAILPPLERDDFLALPNLQAKDGEYQLKIANQAEEIQYTNLTELSIVDHPLGTQVLADRKGNYWTLRNLQPPITAVSSAQKNVLSLFAAQDSLKYSGGDSDDPEHSKDAVELRFAKPDKAEQAKLVLKARNSLWLDYTMGQFLDLFGEKYDLWYSRQSGKNGDMDPDWARKQGIPLSVYLKQDGHWEFVDYFPVIGPMAEREVVMPLDLSRVKGKDVELKLECSSRFWEIDSAALDFSLQERLLSSEIALSKATTDAGRDVKSLLSKADKKYFVQPQVGESAILRFKAPRQSAGMARTVFLHSRGHYKIIRKAKGEPDVTRLEKFRLPGSFGTFSQEQYRLLQAQHMK